MIDCVDMWNVRYDYEIWVVKYEFWCKKGEMWSVKSNMWGMKCELESQYWNCEEWKLKNGEWRVCKSIKSLKCEMSKRNFHTMEEHRLWSTKQGDSNWPEIACPSQV